MKIKFLICVIIVSGTNLIVNAENCNTQSASFLKYLLDLVDSSSSQLKLFVDMYNKMKKEVIKDLVTSILNSRPVPKVTHLPLPRLITKEGYPFENHEITTSDGYILNVFRIPHPKFRITNVKVVLLVHDLITTATDWVLLGKKHGLAFQLIKAGYDVWLANCRGNQYSTDRVRLNVNDKKFWDFSFHEMGVFDIPRIIDYILWYTNRKRLFYVGYGTGNTVFYVMASMKPEYNNKIAHQISLSPAVFESHSFSPILQVLALFDRIGIRIDRILPAFRVVYPLWDMIIDFCSGAVEKVFCKHALFHLLGVSYNQLNASDIPLILTYYPSSFSTKALVHYLQVMNSGRFSQFDYGLKKNQEHYNCSKPPDYDLSKITALTTLIYSNNDWFSSPVDVKKLSEKLTNVQETYELSYPFAFADFIFGKDAPSAIYQKIIEVFDRH